MYVNQEAYHPRFQIANSNSKYGFGLQVLVNKHLEFHLDIYNPITKISTADIGIISKRNILLEYAYLQWSLQAS